MSAQFNYYNQNINFNPLLRNSFNSFNSFGSINGFNNFNNNMNYNVNNINIFNSMTNNINRMNYNLNTINNFNNIMNNTNRNINNSQLYNNPNSINSNQNNYLINRIKYSNQNHVPSSPLISNEKTNIIINQLNNNVCKIYKSNGDNATGFFCKIPFAYTFLPVLITNNHVLNEEDIKANRIIQLSLEDGKIEKKIIINESRITFTNKDLDVTIIEIIPRVDGINNFLEVDGTIDKLNLKEKIKEPIYILQYPEGKSSYSYGNVNDSSNKSYDNVKDSSKLNEQEILYSCSTSEGSSGAPILNLINNKVIGVHKGREKDKGSLNLGTLMKYIVDSFGKTYNINKSKFKMGEKDKESKIKYFDNNEYYVGHLKKGKASIYYSNGKLKYEGDCLDGKFEGRGTYYYEGGNRYDGEWQKGLKHGKGILYYDHEAKIKRYEGNFTKGKFDGKGIYYWNDGSYYIGDFANGLKHGYGKYFKDGTLKYEGGFINDKFGGKGKYFCDKGDYYVGDFKDGFKHGKGVLFNKKNVIINEGYFVNNKYQGKK